PSVLQRFSGLVTHRGRCIVPLPDSACSLFTKWNVSSFSSQGIARSLVRRLGSRQRKEECRADANFAFHAHIAAMGLDDALCNDEAESGPLSVTSGIREPNELLKHVLHILWGNTASGVTYLKAGEGIFDRISRRRDRDVDFALFPVVLDGVR